MKPKVSNYKVGREQDMPEKEHDTSYHGGCVCHPMEAFGLKRRGDNVTMIYDPTKPIDIGHRVVILYGDRSIRPRRGIYIQQKGATRVMLNSQGKMTWFKIGKSDLIARLVGSYEPVLNLEPSKRPAKTRSTSAKSKTARPTRRTRKAV